MTGLNQAEFAAEIDVSAGTIRNYELGKVEPRRIVLKQWGLRSGVPLYWLVRGIGENEESPSGGPDGDSGVHPSGLEPETHWLRVVRDAGLSVPERQREFEPAAA